MKEKFRYLLCSLALMSGVVNADTQVNPELALQMLNEQSLQFKQGVVQVTDNVFTAVGFHGANTSMIVGTDGVIIIDTLMGPESASNAFAALRKYSDKPVKAIIYTHSHDDHTGGASAFAGNDNPAIYAMAEFGSALGVSEALRPILIPRGARQFGRSLAPDEATNRGLAPAITIDHDRGKGYLAPTVAVTGDSLKTTIAGIDIEMHSGPGETDDALFIWLPKEKVLFSGDNFYQAFPNLYAIRGTAYRNVLDWSNSVAKMATFKPDYLVPGHTTPIIESENATAALKDYSDAIRSVYEQTVSGINLGKSPEQIAHEVTLPNNLQDKPYLKEFYGTIHHSVKAIYAGLLGWYDGNPTTLNQFEPSIQAKKMAALAGGTKALSKKMLAALNNEDFQWALELSDHLKWLDDADKNLARKTKIKALRGLATHEYNAPNRNYYLTYANDLESGKLSDIWY
jgi:uncharacterized sulfatase